MMIMSLTLGARRAKGSWKRVRGGLRGETEAGVGTLAFFTSFCNCSILHCHALQVHQRWHLWRRNYDLYFGRRQFAAITGSFLAW